MMLDDPEIMANHVTLKSYIENNISRHRVDEL
jgi:hypothetical protein